MNTISQNNNYGKDIKDIPRSTWNLLTNKIYMVTCMGACMELIIVSGFIVFLPKYLETQFNLGKSEASMFTGGIAIPGACIGIFLGGYLLKRMQLRPLGAVQVRNPFDVDLNCDINFIPTHFAACPLLQRDLPRLLRAPLLLRLRQHQDGRGYDAVLQLG